MLQTIGYVYGRQDAKELGKSVYSLGVPFAAEWFRSKAHSIEIHVTDDSGAIQSMQLKEYIENKSRVLRWSRKSRRSSSPTQMLLLRMRANLMLRFRWAE